MGRKIFLIVIFAVIIISVHLLTKNKPKDTKDVKESIKEEPILQEVKQEIKKEEEPQISVAQKKQNFLDMIVPALDVVYKEEQELFEKTKKMVEENPNSPSLLALQEKYRAANNLELLMALKPHPKSITIAQGAMESAWGTSRFFKEANNIFGVWSFNKNEPRIPAGEQRGDKTIWLKKYATFEDSIRDYYLTLSRSGAFEDFRKLNYELADQNPYLLVKELDRYSEKKEVYGQELASMISFNNFTRFDAVQYKKTKPQTDETSKIEKEIEIEKADETSKIEIEKTDETSKMEIEKEIEEIEKTNETNKKDNKIEKEEELTKSLEEDKSNEQNN